MNLTIYLKERDHPVIIEKIERIDSISAETTIEDFQNFFFSDQGIYSFQGETTVVIRGESIHYLVFA